MARSLELVELEQVGDTICGNLSAIKACSALVRHGNRKIWLGPEKLVSIVERGLVQGFQSLYILKDARYKSGLVGLLVSENDKEEIVLRRV